jgi:hypothetical protein
MASKRALLSGVTLLNKAEQAKKTGYSSIVVVLSRHSSVWFNPASKVEQELFRWSRRNPRLIGALLSAPEHLLEPPESRTLSSRKFAVRLAHSSDRARASLGAEVYVL